MARESMAVPNAERTIWVALRLVLGFILVWSFFDKLLGLGFSTRPGHAWINGVSPTTGYLTHTTGWFSGFFSSLGNNVVVDAVFMAALLLIGLALLLGIGLKIAAVAGTLLFILLWLSGFPPQNNPIVDEHIVYIFVVIGIAVVGAGRWFGLGGWWAKLPFVRKHPILM